MLTPPAERSTADALSAGSFIRRTLARVRAEAQRELRIRRSYGPVAFNIVASGLGADASRLDRLLRYAARSDDGAAVTSATLYVCNGEASSLGPPPETWPFPIADAASFHRTYWSAAEGIGLASDERHGVWYMADLKARELIVWIRDASELPEWEEAAPLRHCFHWCAHSAGAVVAHAAAFGFGGSFVLVTGPGGTGKSTLTAAAAGAGFTILSEDLCWLERASGAPLARRLYDNIKIAHGSAQRFPGIAWPLLSTTESGFSKTILRLPRQEAACGAIRALFCLSGAFAEQPMIKPCSKAVAYRLLAPSTVFLMRTAIVETSAWLKHLVEMLPTFEVTPGADPVATAKALIEKAGSTS